MQATTNPRTSKSPNLIIINRAVIYRNKKTAHKAVLNTRLSSLTSWFLALAPFGFQVAGRSQGQTPHATLHDFLLYFT
jgi:hypothetical protein